MDRQVVVFLTKKVLPGWVVPAPPHPAWKPSARFCSRAEASAGLPLWGAHSLFRMSQAQEGS